MQYLVKERSERIPGTLYDQTYLLTLTYYRYNCALVITLQLSLYLCINWMPLKAKCTLRQARDPHSNGIDCMSAWQRLSRSLYNHSAYRGAPGGWAPKRVMII